MCVYSSMRAQFVSSSMRARHGVKYIELYLNTNSLEGFKYKYL